MVISMRTILGGTWKAAHTSSKDLQIPLNWNEIFRQPGKPLSWYLLVKINITFFLVSQVYHPACQCASPAENFKGQKRQQEKKQQTEARVQWEIAAWGRQVLAEGRSPWEALVQRGITDWWIQAVFLHKVDKGGFNPSGEHHEKPSASIHLCSSCPSPGDLLNWLHFCCPKDKISFIIGFKGWFCLNKELRTAGLGLFWKAAGWVELVCSAKSPSVLLQLQSSLQEEGIPLQRARIPSPWNTLPNKALSRWL